MTLKSADFYRKYDNLPILDRYKVLDAGGMTLSDIHDAMNRLEGEMRPLKIREQELLEKAAKFFNRIKK